MKPFEDGHILTHSFSMQKQNARVQLTVVV